LEKYTTSGLAAAEDWSGLGWRWLGTEVGRLHVGTAVCSLQLRKLCRGTAKFSGKGGKCSEDGKLTVLAMGSQLLLWGRGANALERGQNAVLRR
jgi:hypothetical protein